jgi:hypothetical protein
MSLFDFPTGQTASATLGEGGAGDNEPAPAETAAPLTVGDAYKAVLHRLAGVDYQAGQEDKAADARAAARVESNRLADRRLSLEYAARRRTDNFHGVDPLQIAAGRFPPANVDPRLHQTVALAGAGQYNAARAEALRQIPAAELQRENTEERQRAQGRAIGDAALPIIKQEVQRGYERARGYIAAEHIRQLYNTPPRQGIDPAHPAALQAQTLMTPEANYAADAINRGVTSAVPSHLLPPAPIPEHHAAALSEMQPTSGADVASGNPGE